MIDVLLLWASALWLGILTSISPCPLATNLAALSFVGRRVDRPGFVAASGALYTLGRVLAYTVLGALLVTSVLAAPSLSRGLQMWLNFFLGPALILVGMVVLDLISMPSFGFSGSFSPERVERLGLMGSLLMGLVFALSFCPVSAAIFFGSLVPLAASSESTLALPIAYGIGTGLPVLLFAVFFAMGVKSVGGLHRKLTDIAKWGRWATGVVLILAGIYLALIYVFRVQLF